MKTIASLCLIMLIAAFSGESLLADHIYHVDISPKVLELNIGSKPLETEIRLTNNSDTRLTLKTELHNWTIDEHNSLKIVPSDVQSLDRLIAINPEEVTIEPGKEAIVRISVKPGPVYDPGEHRAILYFTETHPSETLEGYEIVFRQGVGIYGYNAPLRREVLLNNLSFDRASGTLSVDITNKGNVHTRFHGDYAIWKKGAFPGFKSIQRYLDWPHDKKKPEGFEASGSLNITPVLSGTRRTIKTKLPQDALSEGYTVTVTAYLEDEKIEKVFE